MGAGATGERHARFASRLEPTPRAPIQLPLLPYLVIADQPRCQKFNQYDAFTKKVLSGLAPNRSPRSRAGLNEPGFLSS